MEDISNVFIDPEVPEVDYAELEFDQQLKHTQRIKGRLLHKLVYSNPDGSMPTDKDSVELMLKVADSMDKVAINKKRISVDEKSGNSALSILQGIAQMVAQGGNDNMFTAGAKGTANTNTDIGELPDFSGEHASGEAEIGVISEISDSFTARMTEVNRQDQLRREREMGLTGVDVPT
jgi:hypothetical protein